MDLIPTPRPVDVLDPATSTDPQLNRIEGSNTLEPGHYWRVVQEAAAKDEADWYNRVRRRP